MKKRLSNCGQCPNVAKHEVGVCVLPGLFQWACRSVEKLNVLVFARTGHHWSFTKDYTFYTERFKLQSAYLSQTQCMYGEFLCKKKKKNNNLLSDVSMQVIKSSITLFLVVKQLIYLPNNC